MVEVLKITNASLNVGVSFIRRPEADSFEFIQKILNSFSIYIFTYFIKKF